MPPTFFLFHHNILDKNKSRKHRQHNFTFKDINSRPIINSIEFHLSFLPLLFFYIFPITENNNPNKTNRTQTTEASNLEHHHFSLHNFSSVLIYFCFSWCYNQWNQHRTFLLLSFCSVRYDGVIIPCSRFHYLVFATLFYIIAAFVFGYFSAILFFVFNLAVG